MTQGKEQPLNTAAQGVSPTASTLPPPPKPFTGHTASDFTVPAAPVEMPATLHDDARGAL